MPAKRNRKGICCQFALNFKELAWKAVLNAHS
jgi:hypothetical protein